MITEIKELNKNLPPINTKVLMFHKDKDSMFIGSLKIYDKKICHLTFKNNPLKNGDIYWDRIDGRWSRVEKFIYWAFISDFLKLTFKEEDNIENRFNLLDLEKDTNI